MMSIIYTTEFDFESTTIPISSGVAATYNPPPLLMIHSALLQNLHHLLVNSSVAC